MNNRLESFGLSGYVCTLGLLASLIIGTRFTGLAATRASASQMMYRSAFVSMTH